MALEDWMIKSGWVEGFFAVYRPAKNDPKAVVPVTACASVGGRRKATSNFDRPKSLAGQSNVDNFDTSDELRFPVGFDVRAGDKVLILGTGEWFTIAGQPTIKTVIPRQVAYITTTTKPRILDGVWSDS